VIDYNALRMPASSTQVDCVLDAGSLLGESPVWCPTDQVLYWVDIKQPTVHRFHPATGSSETWTMPEDIGSLALRKSGGLVVALRTGFALVDVCSGAVTRFGSFQFNKPDMRFNDGRSDPAGRFWAGTLHEKRAPGTASLYRLEPGGGCSPMIDGLTVSNGLAWSPDGRTMYFADSWTKTIFQCDFDLDTGVARNQRVFAQLPPDRGVPDGATVDTEGFLWSANFAGGCVTRYTPDGRVDRVIAVPVPLPTSCAFGGPDLSILYITSASMHLTAEQRAAAPLSGGIFAADTGFKGLEEPRFAG